MLGVLEGFAIILMVIFIGYLLARFRVITSDDQRLVLNRVAFYAATPALIFMVVSQSSRDALFSPVILVEALTALVTSGIFVAVSHRFFPTDRASTVMGAAATAYVNSNNIGLPVGMYVLGNAGYVAPLLVVQMTIFTPLVLALISDNNTTGSRARKVSGAIASSLVSPMSFGASLTNARPLGDPTQRPAAITATALKVVGMPIIAVGLGFVCGLRGDELYAVVILSSLPTAQNVYN